MSYCQGVSPGGKQFYDNLLRLAGDRYAPMILALFTHYEIQAQLSRQICRQQAKLTLEIVRQTVINQRLAECLDYVIARIEDNAHCVTSSEFKTLSAQYINWNAK